jgi:hypothetical protein
MNRIDFSNEGGFPLRPEDFEYLLEGDRGIYNTINTTLAGFNQDMILSGCSISGNDVSAGVVYINGEILRIGAFNIGVDGTYLYKVNKNDSAGMKSFKDGLTINVYEYDEAEPTTTDTGVDITELDTLIDVINGKRNGIFQGSGNATATNLSTIETITANVTPNRYKNIGVSFNLRAQNGGEDVGIQIAIYKNGTQLQSDVYDYASDESASFCQIIPTSIEPGDVFELKARKTTTYGASLSDINISFF